MDRILAHDSNIKVVIPDRFLGSIYYALQLTVLCTVAYFFILDEGHREWEHSRGVSALLLDGEVVSDVNSADGDADPMYFGTSELFYPPADSKSVFVATQIARTNQFRGVCEDKNRPCEQDKDCWVPKKSPWAQNCTGEGFCVEPSWCSDGPTTTFDLESQNARMWVKSAVNFPRLDANQVII